MLTDISRLKVYLWTGQTDMRKSINTLSILVQESMRMDPFSESIFLFCNRSKRIIKALYWERNGFCLWQKKLEEHRFHWPQSAPEAREITPEQLAWLLSGLDFTGAHERLNYSSVL
jgi:transposase